MKRITLVAILTLGLTMNIMALDVLRNLNQTSDWRPAHDVSQLQQTQRGLQFESTAADPYIQSNALNFDAAKYAAIVFEMSVTSGAQLQLFWATRDDPNFTEGKSKKLPLSTDGQFHSYTMILSNHVEWKGEIIRLRLDPTDAKAKIRLASFKIIDRAGAIIKPVFFHPNKPIANPGQAFQLTACYRNEGDAEGMVKLSLTGLDGNDDAPQTKTLIIPPFERGEASWDIKINEECMKSVSCQWESGDRDESNKSAGALQSLITIVSDSADKNKVVIEGDKFSISLFQTKMGYGSALILDQNKSQLAVMPYLSLIKILHNDGSIGLYPVMVDKLQFQGDSDNISRLGFSKTIIDRDGREWNFTGSIEKLSNLPDAFRYQYYLTSNGGRLLYFSGPEMYIGEASFGGAKDMAVLPGIEYLDRDAVSSSDAVAHPPVRDQYIPHPYKNTIPYMSLTHQGNLISLLWPANLEWAPGRRGYSLKFAVPNRLYGQENSLFGLFIPNVPDFTLENHDMAFEPYIMQQERPVTIGSVLYLSKSDDPNDALDAWLQIYGKNHYGGNPFPDPMPAPRSYAEEIQLSRQAYLHTCWNEDAKGWGHCAGWSALSSGGMLALLDLDVFLNPGGADQQTARQRSQLVHKHILETQGVAGLGSPAGCHVMRFEPAFYWGVTEALLPQWMRQASSMRASQNPEGGWGFHPSKDRQMLGGEGQVVSGTISPNAMFLMRLALITGDDAVTRSGLKALEALNRRSVPRGAQGWECPIAAADILVSAHGARANLDAFQITGNRKYLDKAVYWAKSGIPFHYLWNLEDRPLQRYATIPIFGTTFFHHTWLGVPVQWCGLVYSYALQELAPFDDSYPWLKIATGIVNSAMLQQMTEGEYIGTLPDSYGEYFTRANGAWINPENIMTNLHALQGNSLNIRTVFPGQAGVDKIRISANADITNNALSEKYLEFSVQSKKGRNTAILIAPVDEPPSEVAIESSGALDKLDTLFEQQGWRYLVDQKALLINLKHNTGNISLRLSF